MPGIIGYIVKAQDTLWDIAKQHYTTIDAIKRNKQSEDDNINEGDKLLILKR